MPPDPATADDLQSLLRRACAELERRLRAGEDCRAEEFLEAHPGLASNPDSALELIRAEWLARKALGQHGSAEEWLTRFPQWRGSLQRWLEHDAVVLGTTDGGVRTVPLHERNSAPGQAEPALAPELSLDEHQILGELGRGGMGVVYRAWDPTLKREVALKKIRAGTLATPDQVRRFYREAQAAARLLHPNLVPIHGMGLHRGEHCFTMPLLGGGSLEQKKTRFRDDPRSAVVLVEKVARAVQVAHEKGILHRDLKPANILLDERGEPLVSDFGLAKFADGSADETQSGQVLGTPAYMAPEQAAGRSHELGPASDVWALGVILYELLTGHRPFGEGAAKEVIARVLNEEPPRPHSREPELDRALEAVVLKCLKKDVSRRYSSAGELADDLGRWLHGKTVRAQRDWLVRAALAVRKHRVASLALGTVGAALLGLAILLLRLQTSPASDSASPQEIHFLETDAVPRSSRWLAGEGSHARPGSGTLRLDPPRSTVGLFELLSSVPWDRYRFTAEVLHEGEQKGTVGLYAGHVQQELGTGEEHWFAALSFAERPQLPPSAPDRPARSTAHFLLYRYRPPSGDEGVNSSILIPRDQHFSPVRGTWRRLTIEVTPETVRAYWGDDRAPFSHLIRTTLMREMVRELAGHEPRALRRPALLQTRGGLGLFCNGGSALFRNLVVGALLEDENGSAERSGRPPRATAPVSLSLHVR